ncbi:hypothetical protein O6H91_09G008600 [Diphasiastrum complanatum]|uniref:Uncharacterized protein n=3 Tax=Diphasiastrum complanatum TaxID=34168 RepID=A0ACC2CLA7_DIPCM|nr:hypothetical protein O6H91_09G008200 [Diphasiastrum complanatum]KAJ7542723.1 hypothetical protein O6H91_09G008600 [Diphasiastrum complanatum]KAJ7542724.1 hypothetical protein O6H91_09G008600 [Diphasiastrum complanatum]
MKMNDHKQQLFVCIRSICFHVFIWLLVCSNLSSAVLVPEAPLILDYHNGPVLSASPIKVFLLFYGSFSNSEKSAIRAFLASTSAPAASKNSPSVSKWWSITRGYVDSSGNGVAQQIALQRERTDNKYSLGKQLTKSNLTSLVLRSLKFFPTDPNAVYLVLTDKHVYVEGFCQDFCGQHFYTYPSVKTQGKALPYAWVGNSETQCPGFCAWPYAKPLYGPPAPPLVSPNGVGVDGLIITLAKVLAGAATNPFGNGYYQGDATVALEAAGACASSYGPGSYPGYPGDLLKDSKTEASYNVQGIQSYKFLVPWIWNPATLSCAGQP